MSQFDRNRKTMNAMPVQLQAVYHSDPDEVSDTESLRVTTRRWQQTDSDSPVWTYQIIWAGVRLHSNIYTHSRCHANA